MNMIKNENVLLPMSLILTRTAWLIVLRNETMVTVSADFSTNVSVAVLQSPSAAAMILTFVFSTNDTANNVNFKYQLQWKKGLKRRTFFRGTVDGTEF